MVDWEAGDLLGPVEIGPVAHGGHCVARVDGVVVFVRHALPGETVMVRVTGREKSFARGDAVTIITPHPERTEPPCPVARPGGCGGCDFQHATLALQRRLKTDVVAEQLRRLAGHTWRGEVEGVPDDDGLGWRTRMRYRVTGDGRLGLRAHRSHEVIGLPEGGCRIADPALPAVPESLLTSRPEEVLVAGRGEREGAVLVDGALVAGRGLLTETVHGIPYAVAADGFWQVHPAAAGVLVEAVLDGLNPQAGERAWDLYCGVGLFSAALAEAGCRVRGVELDRRAVDLAQSNVPGGSFVAGRVERVVARWPGAVDLVVLDPPRTGAGRDVVRAVAERRPRRVAYVACDPAALARDVATFAGLGMELVDVRALDLFPMTHHVECVALLEPAPGV